MKKTILSIVAYCLLFAIIIGAAYYFNLLKWNDGACPCGTEWEFANASRSKNSSTTYYYHCPSCNKVIDLIFNLS